MTITPDTPLLTGLRAALGPELAADVVLHGPDTAPYCRDWHGDVQSGALAVLRPRDTAQVSACLRAAQALGLGVVPQGGRTGLVLGAVPDTPARQVVLSLERMTRIRSIDADDFTAEVEAGVILQTLKDTLAEAGLFFPLALGAQGSCQIGGNLSTNAGGLNVLRYGMTRDLVLGLEVVLPDGRVLDLRSRLRKDNRGLDLKQLFIGAEGTLGVITAATLKLGPLPEHTATALLALDRLEDAIALFRLARLHCCDLMSAFEFMPPLAFTLAHEAMPDLPIPMATDAPAYVLMDLAGSGLVDVADLMERFLELAMSKGLVCDGVIAQSHTQARALWQIREGMNDGQAKRGRHLRTDVSVPLSCLPDFVAQAEAAVTAAMPGAVCVSYGHVGDGNVHLNVLPAPGTDADHQIEQAKKLIYQVLARFDGSISAEHGIGRLKRADFQDALPPTQRDLLDAIKRAIDPAQIMNPNCQLSHAQGPVT
ncbi:MAG: FAD-binding oxidoreductase [Rhodobacteraceae bacterium]|nr:FAD-binding oxidoreductase [Paracoccaceae bacterium]